MSLTTKILPDASDAIWEELKKLARPLNAVITTAATDQGLDPNYLSWLIRSGENWPSVPAGQVPMLRVSQRLLQEAGGSGGRFTPPADLLQDGKSTAQAMKNIATQMPALKRSVASAYVKGLGSMTRQIKTWRKTTGGAPWSDNEARMFLHGVLQDELKSGGARGIRKSVLLWEVIQAIS